MNASSAGAATVPALELRSLTQRFGLFTALNDVDFRVWPQEIVALVGQNGSGKSTLVKVLAGVNVPEDGSRLLVNGREVALPLAGGQFRQLGLSFVHQDLGLVRTLSVTENFLIGDARITASHRPIHWRAEDRRIRDLLASYDVDLDPGALVRDLAPLQQALVAIARAAEDLRSYRESNSAEGSVLFLDEPTVFLPEDEVEFLFGLVRKVVAGGASCVFISHDLSAVERLCERVVVLRDGEIVGDQPMAGVDSERLVELIVGTAQDGTDRTGGGGRTSTSVAGTPARCAVQGLAGGQLRGVDITLQGGETVGLAGLLGSGAEEVPYLLFGSRRADHGTMRLDDATFQIGETEPPSAVARGIGLVPADRRRDGMVPTLTVSENSVILVADKFATFGRLRLSALRELVHGILDRFGVRPRDPGALMGKLSGGNAQKVVIAKWLEIGPRLLLLHEPTQGVDVGARAAIYELLQQASKTGMSTLWVSSDFEELANVCDRVLVLVDGRVTSELSGERLTKDNLNTAVFTSPGATLGTPA
ncbi:sugar ABC transporter ATP-binding protein [Microbacterium kribbense]|uniref:Sugar ABC transporter ATP-binding protein n=1 Tax=Microbacterium kribbense TaxID=433645 RepID=A0ABP7GFZ7_9MICO